MKAYVVVLISVIMISVWGIVFSYAGAGTANITIKSADQLKALHGEVLTIDKDFYVVRDSMGKEVRLHFDASSIIMGKIEPGVLIEARVSRDGHILSLQPLLPEEQGKK